MEISFQMRLKSSVILTSIAVFLSATTGFAATDEVSTAPGRTMARQATKGQRPGITVDHSRLEALNRPFLSGPEITNACLGCHTEAETQFHQTIHWTWIADPLTGKAGYSLNNFCISTNKTADKGCMSCHPGWGKRGRGPREISFRGYRLL